MTLTLDRPGTLPAVAPNADALQRQGARERRALASLTLPGAALIFVVLILPIGWLFWQSFFGAAGQPTLENYARMLKPVYVRTFVTTFEVSGLVTLACVLLGYPVAYLLAQLPERLAGLLMIFVILPFWTSVLVRTYAWLVLLQRTGIINTWLVDAGLISEPLPLVHNMLGVVIGMVHVMLPFLILPLYASMRAIDPVYMRAAANCGATPAQAFRQVFLPLSLPGLAAGVGLVFVLCLGFYVTPALLGGGRVSMWAMQIADNISVYGNWGAASSLGVVLLIVTGIILYAFKRLFRTENFGGTH
ncbi:ABC transporter permease [Mesorhizobium sp. 8]|uniref:ABC transporter permease n=1 Tax=Mesorhizobium sp. 8 TaxID=2584466 RepID=UPI00112309E9|nr:ABC transporter permease [Mesorhizobium sp. 8]QDC00713.1 ABC transporter permease [Mesorhizobium sp. 8]